MHRRHRNRHGRVDVARDQIFGIEAKRELVVRPELEDREAADRDKQPQCDPVPCADAVGERTATEERASERRRKDQRRGPPVEAFDCRLLLKQAAKRLLIDERRTMSSAAGGIPLNICPIR
jgi:hypothetical protein